MGYQGINYQGIQNSVILVTKSDKGCDRTAIRVMQTSGDVLLTGSLLRAVALRNAADEDAWHGTPGRLMQDLRHVLS